MTCKINPRILILFIVLQVLSLSAYAQPADDSPVKCHQYSEKLDAYNQDLVTINNVDRDYVCAYAHMTTEDYVQLSMRLSTALAIYDELAKLSEDWNQLIKGSSDPKAEYWVKSAATKLLLVSICHRINDYVEYGQAINERMLEMLNKDNSSFKQYLKQKSNWWMMQKETYIRETSDALSKLDKDKFKGYEIDKNILKALLLYYDGAATGARDELEQILTQVEAAANLDKEQQERFVFVLHNWLAYLDLESGKLGQASKSLDKQRAFRTLSPGYHVEWSDNAFKAVYNITNRGDEWRNQYLNLAVEDPSYRWHVTTLTAKDDNGKAVDVFHFQTYVSETAVEPGTMFRQTESVWRELQSLDGKTTLASIKQRQSKKAKIEDGLYSFQGLPKGQYKVQIEKHKARYLKAEQILNELARVKHGWDVLVSNNKDISLFRAYRIKTNLAYHYMQQNKNNIMEFFLYYSPKSFKGKVKDREIQREEAMELMNKSFGEPALKQIEADLQYLKLKAPEHSLYIVAEAEVLAYTADPQTAIQKIEALKSLVSEEATLYGTNVRELLKFYGMVASYRLGTFDGFNEMVEKSVELTKNTAILEQVEHLQNIQRERVKLLNPNPKN